MGSNVLRTVTVFLLLYAMGVATAVAQGISMGGHYAAEGEHPRVFWTLEGRSPSVGPVELAVTHSALKYTGAQTLDRTDIALLGGPDWPVRPVGVLGLEASRQWVDDGIPGPCGDGTDYPPCQQEWYTGAVYGFGLSAGVAGGRVDVRYLRHPSAETAKGALLVLIGVDL